MKSCLMLTIVAAGLLVGMAEAGQGAANAHAQGQAQGLGNDGQVTSDCNHQANSRGLKGQERKQFVEWCQDRGATYMYDDNRWHSERSCYQKADEKGLSGDKRRKFLKNFFENHPPQRYSSDKTRASK